jgi:transposase
LTDSGFDASVLSEFRTRLINGNAEAQLFETMLTLFQEQGLLKPRGRQRTDSTHVLAAIPTLNRLECVGEALRHARNRLATLAPEWLQVWVPTVWFDRSSRRFEDYRLPPGKAERSALAEEIGTDGRRLLLARFDPATPAWLREGPAVAMLRRVWIQQFYAPDGAGRVRWRSAEDLPPAALLISSPYDPDARYGRKRETEWTGYKVHLSETCDDETPNLLTDVTTTPATTTDVAVLPEIQESVAERKLTPSEHIVDAGYMSADHLLTSQRAHGIELLGPVAEDRS